MEKTVTIKYDEGTEQEKTIELALSNNMSWVMEYKDQFNTDILPVLMPLLLSLTNVLAGLAEAGVKFEEINVNDLKKILGTDSMTEAMYKLAAFEFTDFLNIVWALNKAADENIPEPRKWVRQFETFPLDDIAPVVFELVAKGVMSSKTWERLQAAKTSLQPKPKKTKKK